MATTVSARYVVPRPLLYTTNEDGFVLCPAIYDKYVVVGDGSQGNVYSL